MTKTKTDDFYAIYQQDSPLTVLSARAQPHVPKALAPSFQLSIRRDLTILTQAGWLINEINRVLEAVYITIDKQAKDGKSIDSLKIDRDEQTGKGDEDHGAYPILVWLDRVDTPFDEKTSGYGATKQRTYGGTGITIYTTLSRANMFENRLALSEAHRIVIEQFLRAGWTSAIAWDRSREKDMQIDDHIVGRAGNTPEADLANYDYGIRLVYTQKPPGENDVRHFGVTALLRPMHVVAPGFDSFQQLQHIARADRLYEPQDTASNGIQHTSASDLNTAR